MTSSRDEENYFLKKWGFRIKIRRNRTQLKNNSKSNSKIRIKNSSVYFKASI